MSWLELINWLKSFHLSSFLIFCLCRTWSKFCSLSWRVIWNIKEPHIVALPHSKMNLWPFEFPIKAAHGNRIVFMDYPSVHAVHKPFFDFVNRNDLEPPLGLFGVLDFNQRRSRNIGRGVVIGVQKHLVDALIRVFRGLKFPVLLFLVQITE